MSIFLNDDAELRSGWKFCAYVVLFVIILLATAIGLSAVVGGQLPADDLLVLALNAVSLLVPAVLALLLMVRFVDHKPLSAFGVGFHAGARREFLGGLAIAAGMLGILMLGAVAFGDLGMRWTAGETSLGRLALTLAMLMVAAANEELIFRGYPLQVLMRGIGTWPAILLLSIIFGALHMMNPNASALGTVNTILAGIVLSIAYVQTRWLWLPYGIHIGWNAGLGFVLGFPLSGLDIASLWTTSVSGSDFILGGNYGPEEGLLGTIIFAASAVLVRKGFSK